MEKHKIIVAYDFQELSNASLKQAYDLARFVNSGILLVLVLNDDLLMLSDVFMNEHSDHMKKKITDVMQKEIAERLQKVAHHAAAESGVPVDYRIETGKIYERILEIAKENSARFIVMGKTSKESGRGRFGSNTLHVVEEAPCPVITMPTVACDTTFKNIVLPIDLTKQTREEVFNAISFGLFFNATIHLVSVIMGGISARKSRIYKKMQGMKKMIEENGIQCTDKLFKKSHLAIHEVILEYSGDIHADALMIMTHQEISTSDKYIGAVAHQIINESPISVISLTSAASMQKQNEKSSYWFSKLFTTSK
jgi:nucleotide-binding universal stress UspA family protein